MDPTLSEQPPEHCRTLEEPQKSLSIDALVIRPQHLKHHVLAFGRVNLNDHHTIGVQMRRVGVECQQSLLPHAFVLRRRDVHVLEGFRVRALEVNKRIGTQNFGPRYQARVLQILADRAHRQAVIVDEQDALSPSTQRLDADTSRSGKQIQPGATLDSAS
jgi:hypothetical protein